MTIWVMWNKSSIIAQWKVKLSKYAFGQRAIAYLGHVSSKDGVIKHRS